MGCRAKRFRVAQKDGTAYSAGQSTAMHIRDFDGPHMFVFDRQPTCWMCNMTESGTRTEGLVSMCGPRKKSSA
jgi:hypothetical protein